MSVCSSLPVVRPFRRAAEGGAPFFKVILAGHAVDREQVRFTAIRGMNAAQHNDENARVIIQRGENWGGKIEHA